ncbi:unnamed protein product [Tilletia caries]|uniref:Peroxin-14 n=1 Tax=Tilletia caries TaxID=13290 RepID=A0A177V6W2_9BASI|nr:hypothetical protein CF336_g1704 [Tilletia laevis]KAE8264026.1 hypothetical protein A4X03_0g1244 [Tilletia caries]CAD6884652.1 unnamed protein product [Tilletia caries]CAD6920945.1 unnamed protein product [Tilletia caries]
MSLPSSSSSAEASASASASAGVSSTAAYERLHSWDWSSDPEFQAGIDSITTPLRNAGRSEVQIGEVVKRAQVFYFSQHTTATTPAPASASAPAPAPAPAPAYAPAEDDEREPYPASFDAIAELIATGRVDQIPGIRDIPLEISDEPPSEAKLAPRPKPWELAGAGAGAQDGGRASAVAADPSAPAGFETVSEAMQQ